MHLDSINVSQSEFSTSLETLNAVQDHNDLVQQSPSSLTFIDSRIDDIQTLVSELSETSKIILLDVEQDGLAQVTSVLSQHQNISALDIISHGDSGELAIGNSDVQLEDLGTYQDALSTWQSSLTDHADIRLYGCNVAAGDRGLAFIQQLSQFTGADVAASNDLTGSSAAGGNWQLEAQVGTIDSQPIFSSTINHNYTGILPSGTEKTLTASPMQPDGNGQIVWGDGVVLSAIDLDGNPTNVIYADTFTDHGFGVEGGRYKQIDFVDGQSEKMIIDFNGNVTDVVITFGQMNSNERGRDETGIWTAYDETGQKVAEGLLDPDLSALGPDVKVPGSLKSYPIALTSAQAFNKVVIETTSFDHGESPAFTKKSSDSPYLSAPYEENTDFNIVEMTYTRLSTNDDSGTPPTPDPDPVDPPMPNPDPVDPPTPDPVDPPIPGSQDSVTLKAADASLDGSSSAQTWGSGVSIEGRSASNEAAVITTSKNGLAIEGGRNNNEIDYNPESETSEQLILNFETTIAQAEIELGLMMKSEWNNLPETGIWKTYNSAGQEVDSGILDPTNAVSSGRNSYRFAIESSAVFDQLVIEATGYDNGASNRIRNNSDFALEGITFTPDVMSDDGADPGADPGAGDNGDDSQGDVPGNETPTEEPPVEDPPVPEPPMDEPDPPAPDNSAEPPTDYGTDAILWSDLNPGSGQQVMVAEGQTVIVNQDTANLAGVIVNGGRLIFAENFTDTNGNGELDFTADWLLVRNGGSLEIGTEANPYSQEVTITLDGADEDVMGMGMGGRFIIAAGTAADGTESRISMHGIDGEKVSWTQLSANVSQGSTTIQLAEAVDWEAGDEIVIAPSGFDANEAETRTIVAVDGNTVTLDSPLNYDHFGEIDTVNGQAIDMRAEVGLLSRNIDIQGAADALESEFGAHMMFMDGSSIELSGIEVRNGGQIGKKARYPVHWHLGGDHEGDYIKNSSIYDSFQRGIVLHGVDNVEVDSNVVFNVFSHAYVFSEDGNEFNNQVTNNLGLLVKSRAPEDFSFFNGKAQGKSTQGEHRPSVFWGRNYFNPLVGNHAAGTVDGSGFHVDLRRMSYKTLQTFINLTDANVFEDNVSHSNGTTNQRLAGYAPISRGHGLMLERFGGKVDTKVVFNTFTTYKNDVSGVWMEDSRQVLSNAAIADSSTGIIIRNGDIEDVTITQKSSNSIGGVLGIDKPILDVTDLGGGIHVLLGVSKPKISNVYFGDLDKPAIAIHREARLEDATVSNVTFENTELPLYWYKDGDDVGKGALIDLDGSLLGTDISTLISGPSTDNGLQFFDERFNAFVEAR